MQSDSKKRNFDEPVTVSGGGVDRSAKRQAVDGEGGEKQAIVDVFKHIDDVISIICRKSQHPTWERIQESYNNLGHGVLDVAQFDEVMTICPDLFRLHVMTFQHIPGRHIVIEPADWDTRGHAIDAHSNTKDVVSKLGSADFMKRRVEHFRSVATSGMPRQSSSLLKDLISEISHNKVDPTPTSNKKATGGAFLNLLRLELAKQQAQLLQHQANNSAAPTSSSSSKADSSSKNNTGDQGEVTSLEQLRLAALERGKVTAAHAQQLEAQKQQNAEITRLLSLPTICDVLRTNALISNRKAGTVSELTHILSKDMRIAQSELLIRIRLLADIVPAFVQIQSADRVVPMTTIRFNMDAIYDDVRAKLSVEVNKRVKILKETS